MSDQNDEDPFARFLGMVVGNTSEQRDSERPKRKLVQSAQLPEAKAANLKAAFERREEPRSWKRGDLITQINGMQGYNVAPPGEPAVFIESFPEEPDSSTVTAAVMVVNTLIGVIVDDTWVEFRVDGRRFETWVPGPTEA